MTPSSKLCLTSLLCLQTATALAANTPLNTPILAGIDNFRDVAGTTTAYSTVDGGTLRGGVFYRSNALTPTGSDLAVLNSLNISNVFDLRTPAEVAATPDTLPTGASYTNINIIGTASSASFMPTSAAAAVSMMQDMNRSFVTDGGVRSRFAQLFRDLASSEDAALFHCTAGKDRTGWTAAVLQTLAGVDSATVMSDYLATNTYTAARVSATLAQLNKLSPAAAAIYAPLLGVEASYLQAGLDQVTASYGSMDNYLKEGLGLDQATIYVLRGKLVRYALLPGEQGLNGNAAAGAGLLNALQDSPLSGRYTAYNYYLQSAIDAGTLGGVESQVGGQVHADAASYLLRQPTLIDDTIRPYIAGNTLQAGHSALWMSALAGYLGTDGSDRVASSGEHSTGTLVGMVHRFDPQTSAHGEFGYNHGSISAASGTAKTDSTFVNVGGRYGFVDLETGPYAAVQASAGYIDYDSKRDFGGGLGSAKGSTDGMFYSAKASLGYLTIQGPLHIEPEIGVRVAHLNLDGFQEKGSELALDVDSVNQTVTSLVTDLKLGFDPRPLGDWRLTPALTLGYERALNDPSVTSKATVYGIGIEQDSAFDSRNLYKAGMSLTATHGVVSLGADVKVIGGGDSSGVAGNLSASIAF